MFSAFSRGILANLATVFKGKNLLWHALAIALTAVLVASGADWWFFEATRSDYFFWIIMAAGVGGFFTPIIIPLAIYLYGEFRARRDLMNMGAAVGQASVIAYLISIAYKAITGRVEPEFLTTFSMIDNSHDFNFGFLEYGVFWGWPSSHTAVAFAGAFAIVFLTRNTVARVAALLYALFIATGAAIGFHWLSDVVAGAIFGVLVASAAVRTFKSELKHPAS